MTTEQVARIVYESVTALWEFQAVDDFVTAPPWDEVGAEMRASIIQALQKGIDEDFGALMARLDGMILPGGMTVNSSETGWVVLVTGTNVHPSVYGPAGGATFDSYSEALAAAKGPIMAAIVPHLTVAQAGTCSIDPMRMRSA